MTAVSFAGRTLRLALLAALPLLIQATPIAPQLWLETDVRPGIEASSPISVDPRSEVAISRVQIGDMTGPKLYGDASFLFSGQPEPTFAAFDVPKFGNAAIYANGGAEGYLGSYLPVSYDFTLSSSNPEARVSWQLTYVLYGGDRQSFGATYSGSGLGHFSAANLIDTSNSIETSINGWGLLLALQWDPSYFGESLTVTIPPNSIDFPGVGAGAAVPEPGTYALMGGGLLALVALRRRR